MRKLVLSLALGLVATSALARPSTLAMSCGQARGLVASHGAIVLSTGRHTYDRFVATPGYCSLGEYARPGSAPTLDARHCRLGFVCQPGRPFWDENEDFFFN